MKAQSTPDTEPDLEFDALINTASDRDVPCDVLVWLPRRPEDDAAVAITLRADARSVDLRDLASFRSSEHVERMGLRVEADDVLVRGGKSNSLRPRAARLTLTHVGRLRIQHLRSKSKQASEDKAQEGAGSDALAYFQLVLSSLSYGGQHATPIAHYLGHRNLKFEGTPKSLRFPQSGELHTFELQRHWVWKSSDTGDSVQATSAPVLVLAGPTSALTHGQVSNLTQLGEDACTLLSLAARHRVVPHVIQYAGADFRFEEWRDPLRRQRSVTEEEATGPLIDETELEAYFECASTWWTGLDPDRKDAVRLAIFAVHRLTSSTMESDFIAKFAALEGLAKRWGTGGAARTKFSAMLDAHPVRIGGLWPLFDGGGGEPLYWLRNEIAHGRTVTRFSGALPIANDHLQLWLEHVLLALMGYVRSRTASDWLSAQVPNQQVQVATLRQELREQSNMGT